MTLISRETLDDINRANKERAGGNTKRVKTPAVYALSINDIEIGVREKGKAAGRPFIKFGFHFENNEYSPIEEEFMLSGEEGWVKYGISKMAELFQSAGHELTEVRDLDHLKVLATKHLKNKKVCVAVKVRQTLWERDGKRPVIVNNASAWYYGPASDIERMRDQFDAAGALTLLSEADQARLNEPESGSKAAPLISIGDTSAAPSTSSILEDIP